MKRFLVDRVGLIKACAKAPVDLPHGDSDFGVFSRIGKVGQSMNRANRALFPFDGGCFDTRGGAFQEEVRNG